MTIAHVFIIAALAIVCAVGLAVMRRREPQAPAPAPAAPAPSQRYEWVRYVPPDAIEIERLS